MILGLFSRDHVDWRVYGGRTNEGKIHQGCILCTDAEIPSLVETWLRASRHKRFGPDTHKLVLQSANRFSNFSVGDGDFRTRFIIDVRNITAGDNTTLIFGQTSIERIQKVAQACGVSMESQRSGL
jgi:hypothetical protein